LPAFFTVPNFAIARFDFLTLIHGVPRFPGGGGQVPHLWQLCHETGTDLAAVATKSAKPNEPACN